MVVRVKGDGIQDYVDGVLSGDIIASKWVRLAVRRHVQDLKYGGDRGLVFEESKARNACHFIETFCQHTEGEWAGKPLLLQPWQRFIMWMVFGWRRSSDGLRRFRTAYITVARKAGKTTFAAAIALVCMFMDDPIEPAAHVFSAATTREQASLVHSMACEMIKKAPALNARCRIFKNRDTYQSLKLDGDPYNGSVFKPLAADKDSLDGRNPHLVIEDELHAWQERHRKVKAVLETGSGARRQPLILIATTAGDERSDLWMETDKLATAVLNAAERGAEIDDSYFAFIARIDEKEPCHCDGEDENCEVCGGGGEIAGDDPFDEAVWAKSNPGLGIAPPLSFMQDQARRARNDPSFKSEYLRYHINIQARSTDKVITPAIWSKTERPLTDWSQAVAKAGGFDIGTRDDLAAIAGVAKFECDEGFRYEIRQRSFCPTDGKRVLSRSPYDRWIDHGWLIPTPGETTDLETMEVHIGRYVDAFDIFTWAFDPHNATQMSQNIERDYGVEAYRFVQSFSSYNEPIREFIRLLRNGLISADDDELLAWCFDNLVVKKGTRDDWMPDKRSSADKIDPACAVIMAFGALISDSEEEGGTYYEENELEFG